jgi:hypothetical protein
VPVDRGEEYYFVIPTRPQWNDGSPVDERDLGMAVEIIREAYQYWGIRAHFERGGQ